MMKSVLKRAIRSFGYELRRYRHLTKILASRRIDLVFDIGANVGQYAKSLREHGYRGRIVSFEPVSSSWEQLVDAASRDPLWEVAPRCAIGEKDGEIEIHVSKNLLSSSTLEMLNLHLKNAPDSAYVRDEKVPLRRLDSIFRQYLREGSSVFIKIDTQGSEMQVLLGAQQVLERAIGLQVELSFAELYKGQPLYDEFITYLRAKGFELWDIAPVFVDLRFGRTLQADAAFFRAENGAGKLGMTL